MASPTYCCALEEVSHTGPCVLICEECGGSGDCPECYGEGPELCGCDHCDTTGVCPECHGEGEIADD